MNDQQEPASNRFILLICLALAAYFSYWVIEPFLRPIVLAILIGMLAFPLHDWMEVRLGGRKNLTALLGCLALSVLILLPASLVLMAILKQGINYAVVVREWATEENIHKMMSHPWMLNVKERLGEILPAEILDPAQIKSQALTTASTVGKKFAGVSTEILGSITHFSINFTLLLFVLFFVLRDHEKMISFIRHALPLSRSQEDVLFKEVMNVSKSALLGSLLTAATQGLVGGFGLWLAGFPGLFWGAIMAFTSLIPLVGTALIWVPAALFLLVTGEWGWALFLAVWGVVVVGSVDNFLRPRLVGKGTQLPNLFVLLGTLGGLFFFGPVGVILGPVVAALFMTVWQLHASATALPPAGAT